MAPIEDILAFDIRELKAKLAGANTLKDMAEKEADELRAKLAATEVQRDAALAACRFALDTLSNWWPPRFHPPTDTISEINEALAMTPADAVSVVEERDRLREAMAEIAKNHDAISVWGHFARQALTGPAKGGAADAV